METLSEAQLTHLEHIENLIFMGGDNTINSTVDLLLTVVDLLSGKQNMTLQAKIDGAPSIIVGNDPETGQFFVGTKSLFNKTPKVNYTDEDVDRNHGHAKELAEKLKLALKYLKNVKLSATAIQGDFLFSKKDFKFETINGKKFMTFSPNTITYAIPVNDKLAKEIKSKQIGIAWHTSYSGSTIKDLSASFDIKAPKSDKDQWSIDTNVESIPQHLLLTKKEISSIKTTVNRLRKIRMPKSFQKIFIEKNSSIINQYINWLVKQGKMNPTYKSLAKYIDMYYNDKVMKMKSEKGKQKWIDIGNKMKDEISTYKVSISQIFSIFSQLVDVKELLISKLNQIKRFPTFVKTDQGFKVTNDEGFVAISGDKKSAIKLVSRLEFSKNNFILPKSW